MTATIRSVARATTRQYPPLAVTQNLFADNDLRISTTESSTHLRPAE